MFVPKTLSTVGCPAVLQLVADGERGEVGGKEDQHLATVKMWRDGAADDGELMMSLPSRLGKPGEGLKKDTLVVFYDMVHFKHNEEDRHFFKVKTLLEEAGSSLSEIEATAAGLSLLSKEQLHERIGCYSLSDLKQGDLFVVLSTSPFAVGEGDKKREDLLAVVVRNENKSEDGRYKEEELILPGRFAPQLKADRLPLMGRYSGKKTTKCGKREYHDVHFMKANDKRIQNVCLQQYSV